MIARTLVVLAGLVLVGCGDDDRPQSTGVPTAAGPVTPAYSSNAPKASLPVSTPPAADGASNYLIDTTIPAYGVPSQVDTGHERSSQILYYQIHSYLADLESRILAGSGPVNAAPPGPDADKAPPSDESRLSGYLTSLKNLDKHLHYRNYADQWHIDASFTDLHEAAQLLRIGGTVSEETLKKVEAAKPQPTAKGAAAPAATPSAAAPATPAAASAPTPDAKATPAAPDAAAPTTPATPAAPDASAPATPAVPAADAGTPAVPATPPPADK